MPTKLIPRMRPIIDFNYKLLRNNNYKRITSSSNCRSKLPTMSDNSCVYLFNLSETKRETIKKIKELFTP